MSYTSKEVSSFFDSLFVTDSLYFPFIISASTSNMAKIEEMERLLREAQAEKLRLLEHRVLSQI